VNRTPEETVFRPDPTRSSWSATPSAPFKGVFWVATGESLTPFTWCIDHGYEYHFTPPKSTRSRWYRIGPVELAAGTNTLHLSSPLPHDSHVVAYPYGPSREVNPPGVDSGDVCSTQLLHHPSGFTSWMDLYRAPNPARGIICIFPGGGYARRATHEGEPVARLCTARGYHACVVHYPVAPDYFPEPCRCAVAAMRRIRRMIPDRTCPNRICTLGFSAGGHLAATLGVFGSSLVGSGSRSGEDPARPDLCVLAYPVISFERENGHEESCRNCIGPSPSADLRATLSLEQQVRETTPPTFLWHCIDDPIVPAANSEQFHAACLKRGVPAQIHLFDHGGHGGGLFVRNRSTGGWMNLLFAWLDDLWY